MRPGVRAPWRGGPSAQSTLEWALLVAVVSAALITMSVYIRRALQANMKVMEEQINAEAIRP